MSHYSMRNYYSNVKEKEKKHYFNHTYIWFKSDEDKLQEMNLNMFLKKAIWSHIFFSLSNIYEPIKYVTVTVKEGVICLSVK